MKHVQQQAQTMCKEFECLNLFRPSRFAFVDTIQRPNITFSSTLMNYANAHVYYHSTTAVHGWLRAETPQGQNLFLTFPTLTYVGVRSEVVFGHGVRCQKLFFA